MQIGLPYTVIMRIRRLIKWKYTKKKTRLSKLTSRVEGFLLDNYPSKNLLSKGLSQTSTIQTKMTWTNLQPENALLSLQILLAPHVCIASENPAITLSERLYRKLINIIHD